MPVTHISFDMSNPQDLSVLSAHLHTLDIGRVRRLALLLRVAGEYEDGSREKARAAIEDLLLRFSLTKRAAFITVVGAEGASTPCGFALIDQQSDAPVTGEPGLALGVRLEAPPPEPTIGGVSFAHDVASMVAAAIEDSGMDRSEIQLVIVNVPMATSGQVAQRSRQGRAAAALGAGVALGEIDPAAVTADRILTDASLYTPRVQTFTGPAIRQIEIILIGNSRAAGGDLFAVNTVTQDLLDTRSIRRMMMEAGLRIDADGEMDTDRLIATVAKYGVGADGAVNGAPTTICSSALPPEKHVRAALSGVLGATLHTTRILSTFDPIHQAPPGGGTLCCILRKH